MKRLIGLVLFVLVLGQVAPVTGQAAGGFKDVSANYTFYDEVLYLSAKEIISGFSDGTFKPNNTVTRAQAAIMLGHALNLKGEPRNTKFTDVSSRVTGSGYIASAVEKGIISGFTDGTFRPYAPVTRGQMAIFLNKAFTLTAGKTNSFIDVSSNMAAYQSILNVAANGIASGYSDDTYRPTQPVSRGQFSAFMARTLEPSFRAIQIPDKNLEKAIRDTLHKPAGNITAADMSSIKEMEVSGYSIENLTGIEYAKNLTNLNLGENKISEISALSGLTDLEVLHLYYNEISDISALSGLTNLKILGLGSNKIGDISALSELNNLELLLLPKNKISDISALHGLTKLLSLDLGYNEINDISALSDLTNLTALQLNTNQLSDISALSRMTKLEELRLNSNKLSDISALSSLTKLTMLHLYNNEISDISGLSGLTNLRELLLLSNEISDISILSSLTKLTTLNLNINEIGDISGLSELTNLQFLGLSSNEISDISVLSGLTNLQRIDLTNNKLNAKSLDVIATLKARDVIVYY